MIPASVKVLNAQKRMARYYIQRLQTMNSLHKLDGNNIRVALEQYDTESSQIEQILRWLNSHSDDDVDAERLLLEIMVAGRLILQERLDIQLLFILYEKALSSAKVQEELLAQLICTDMIGKLHQIVQNLPQSLKYYEQAYSLAQQLGDAEHLSLALHRLGSIKTAMGENAPALDWLKQALLMSQKIKSELRISEDILELVTILLYLGEWEQAQNYVDYAHDLIGENKNQQEYIRLLRTMSQLAEQKGQSLQAIAYLKEANELAKTLNIVTWNIETMFTLAMSYDNIADFESAHHYYYEALELAIQTGRYVYRNSIVGSLGYSYYLQGNYEKALEYSELGLTYHQEIQRPVGMCLGLANLVAINIALGHLEEAQIRLLEGMSVAVELDNVRVQLVLIVAGIQYLVALAKTTSIDTAQTMMSVATQWSGFVHNTSYIQYEVLLELDKLRPDMVAILGDTQVEQLMVKGESLALESIIDHILNRL